MNKVCINILLLTGALSISACNTDTGQAENTGAIARTSLTTTSASGKATLPSPAATWEFPGELREVSGIALLPDNMLAAVQDEEGAIYLYDLDKKAVEQKISFGAPGDYEGLVVVGDDAFVLRSDGTIFEVPDFRNGKPEAIAHASVLVPTQNTEGLAYDKANNQLLIACKGYDESLGNNKGIYAFTLADKKMHADPVITISLEQPQLTAATGKKRKSKYDVLQPSSLEIHPVTGELYLMDAKNLYLMTIDEQGNIKKKVNLDKSQLRQPEGLTFGSNGEMYISSEGSKKGKGVLLRFPSGI